MQTIGTAFFSELDKLTDQFMFLNKDVRPEKMITLRDKILHERSKKEWDGSVIPHLLSRKKPVAPTPQVVPSPFGTPAIAADPVTSHIQS